MRPQHHGQAASVNQQSARPRIVAEAERLMYLAKWRLREEEAAARLAGTRGVARTALFPASEVIQVVALGGRVIGRVRRDRGRWIAARGGTPVAERDTPDGAAQALVEAVCGD